MKKEIRIYIESLPEESKKKLLELREIILETLPLSQELINYNILAYTLIKDGKREEQIMIGGFKHHVGLYPHPTTINYFEHELKAYTYSKGSIQFSTKDELPKQLIKQMILYRKSLVNP